MPTGGNSTGDGLAATGVYGLDELLGGGLPAERLHLIEGDPGTGKTTLAMQFLLEGRLQRESCLYVMLSETAQELHAIAESHGWSLDGIELCELASADSHREEQQYTLFHPAEIELGEMVKIVFEAADRVRPSRVVLDSLSELRLLARDPLRYRRQILALKGFFAARRCTALMLDDHTSGAEDMQLRSLAHGSLLLEQEPFEYGRSRRRLRVVKMRGRAVTEGFHDFQIRKGGLEVFPQLHPAEDGAPSSEPIRSGLDELDRLLGGGLSWGTTTLLLGPAGVGKSSISAQYVTAIASKAPGAVYLFDERSATFVERCESLGMSMRAWIESGQLTIEQVEPGELSPGEFAHRVRSRVEDEGCRVVMIDSVNGYLHAIPSGQAPLVRMHELIAYLNARQVATIIVAAQHGVIGSPMGTPLDVTYLADCVVLLRFFEADGHVRKAISVVKKRTGPHETTIRELAIGPGRIRVGGPLTEFHGVMTGVPEYRGSAVPLLREVEPKSG
jgi:circadian clock protein KaiC